MELITVKDGRLCIGKEQYQMVSFIIQMIGRQIKAI